MPYSAVTHASPIGHAPKQEQGVIARVRQLRNESGNITADSYLHCISNPQLCSWWDLETVLDDELNDDLETCRESGEVRVQPLRIHLRPCRPDNRGAANTARCQALESLDLCLAAIEQTRWREKVYADISAAATSLFTGKVLPALLPLHSIGKLMAENYQLFAGTLYASDPTWSTVTARQFYFGTLAHQGPTDRLPACAAQPTTRQLPPVLFRR